MPRIFVTDYYCAACHGTCGVRKATSGMLKAGWTVWERVTKENSFVGPLSGFMFRKKVNEHPRKTHKAMGALGNYVVSLEVKQYFIARCSAHF